MAQFKCKPRSNTWQVFLNHFMSLKSETRKRRQSKFLALTSLTETTSTLTRMSNMSDVKVTDGDEMTCQLYQDSVIDFTIK